MCTHRQYLWVNHYYSTVISILYLCYTVNICLFIDLFAIVSVWGWQPARHCCPRRGMTISLLPMSPSYILVYIYACIYIYMRVFPVNLFLHMYTLFQNAALSGIQLPVVKYADGVATAVQGQSSCACIYMRLPYLYIHAYQFVPISQRMECHYGDHYTSMICLFPWLHYCPGLAS